MAVKVPALLSSKVLAPKGRVKLIGELELRVGSKVLAPKGRPTGSIKRSRH
jgi:hypothetical protein